MGGSNLRCHTLFNPTIRVTMMTRHVTEEGESFMTKQMLSVTQPATISAVHAIAHTVDGASPLRPLLEAWEDGEDEDDILLHATFTALDPVYGAELCCTGQFTNDNIHSDSSFEDYIFVDNGVPSINWDAFNRVRVALCVCDLRRHAACGMRHAMGVTLMRRRACAPWAGGAQLERVQDDSIALTQST